MKPSGSPGFIWRLPMRKRISSEQSENIFVIGVVIVILIAFVLTVRSIQ